VTDHFAKSYDELERHLEEVHCWDEYAYEQGDITYLRNAHQVIHDEDRETRKRTMRAALDEEER